MTDYGTLNAQLSVLVGGVPHRIANLANAAALLYHSLDSPHLGRFTEEDQAGLEEFVRILGSEGWTG